MISCYLIVQQQHTYLLITLHEQPSGYAPCHHLSSLILSHCSNIPHLSSSRSSSSGSSPFQALISHSVRSLASPRSYTPGIFSIVQTMRRYDAFGLAYVFAHPNQSVFCASMPDRVHRREYIRHGALCAQLCVGLDIANRRYNSLVLFLSEAKLFHLRSVRRIQGMPEPEGVGVSNESHAR